MRYYIGCDAHKKYSVFAGISEAGEVIKGGRVEHDRENFRSFLKALPEGSQIALETTGNWYWIVDEMEKAGHKPALVNAGRAKLMMGQINKTDKLDARGLAMLARNGTLPEVWIPAGELRDQRELPRLRMVFVSIRTKLKNRIHATLAKYGIAIDEASDIFVGKGRQALLMVIRDLPTETARSVEEQLELLDEVEDAITRTEKRILQVVKHDRTMQLLDTLPGVGPILAIVIALEVGDVKRFMTSERLASYTGKAPRVSSSGGKTFYGKVRPDVNRYLKWAFTEAANAIVLQKHRYPDRHVSRLYERVREHHGHAKAITAVGRHLAEATYGMLCNNVPYQEPRTEETISYQKRTKGSVSNRVG